jgi:hypothetical protein
MEIRSLVFVATEADLNEQAAKLFARLDALRDLRIAVIPEGIRVTGTYQTLIEIPFQTLWYLSVLEGKVVARLAKLKAGPLSLGLVKRYVLDAIAAKASRLELRGDMLLFDVDSLLRDKGLPLRTNLTSVQCDYGSVMIESG